MMKKGQKNHNHQHRHSEKGQSLVEFTASLIVLVIIVSGVLDIGRAFITFVAIENGAGEGAIFASYHPTWVTEQEAEAGGSPLPEFENISYRAAHESPGGLVDWRLARVTVDHPPSIEPGEPVTVTVTYSYTLMTPFLNIIVGDSILPLQASAAQVILNTE